MEEGPSAACSLHYSCCKSRLTVLPPPHLIESFQKDALPTALAGWLPCLFGVFLTGSSSFSIMLTLINEE